ncbi:TetR/AcrR family transcriptional regulator [Nocardia jejuensis]|uniref:TetR/AcrR family transcriptional regulator n=1 Tax=Nocardia jejuensis TaxID=328049 RepID=UPI0008364FC0|nr:TetR/AcrR family transcriptional regulator [Nocardia jejuensis]
MPQPSARPTRRTQRERREASIEKLVDAAIETIQEDGYYRTTVAAISERAGLSGGGLFRHFDSRLALISRVAEEVSDRILDAYAASKDHLRAQPAPLRAGLGFLAQAVASPLVAVWHELMVAARTDEELRELIAPAIAKFYEGILEHTRANGLLDDVPEESRELALFSMVHMFSGAALTGSVYPRPDLDDKRIPLAEYYTLHTPIL